MRNPMVGKVLRWAGYPLFFFFCFVLFSYWTFPYDRVRDLAVAEAAKRGYELEIVKLSPSWFTGIKLKGVRLVLPERDPTKTPLDVLVDELTVRPSIFGLLGGDKAFGFDVELAGGSADGSVSIGEERSEFDIDIDEVNIGVLPALRRYTKVPMFGIASGTIDLDLPTKVEESDGSVELAIEGLNIGDGKAKIDVPGWGGLTLDRADLGNLSFKVDVKEGKAKIQEATAHGPDIKLDATGSIALQQPLGRSQLDMMARFKVEDAYKKKSSKVAAVLDIASARPGFKNAKTSDDWLQYQIQGSMLGRMRPKPAGSKSFSGSSGK